MPKWTANYLIHLGELMSSALIFKFPDSQRPHILFSDKRKDTIYLQRQIYFCDTALNRNIYLKGLSTVNIILANKINYSFTNNRNCRSTEMILGYGYLCD